MKQLKITKRVTSRESVSIDKYLQEISKYDLVSGEEEADLAVLIRQGDINAFDKLIKANLRFVISVAKQYQNQGLELGDLINEGNIGLVKAARRFDERKGFKFISYAVWWIRQSILQSLAEHARIVRLPMNKIGSISKVNKTFQDLLQRYQREPTVQEISKELEIAPEAVRRAIAFSEKQLSLDSTYDDDEKRDMHFILTADETLSPDQRLLQQSLKKELKRVLATLPTREAEIVKQYYGLGIKHPLTLEEIGEEFDLTRERIRQIKTRAIKMLRSRSAILRKYL